MRSGVVRGVTIAMEGVVLTLAFGSVWPFGSVHSFFLWLLYIGVAALLVGWAALCVLEGRVRWRWCPVVFCLAALCGLTIVQILPLPVEWVSAISPHATEMRQQFTPTLAEGTPAATTATLSLDPGATRVELVRLIAILALFATVRNNILDPGAFYRLAWIMAANGVILSLVGMGQLASSPRNVVFWSVPTGGEVFGPFICRNHAAYYLNLCLGLTAGLLLGTRCFLNDERSNWRDVLRDPRVLWLVCGMAIMLAGLTATLSRGGVVGFLAASIVCLALFFLRMGRGTPVVGFVLVAGMALLLVVWQGSDRVVERFMGSPNGSQGSRLDDRTAIWKRSLPLIRQFPLAGIGVGTFTYLEPTCQVPGDDFTTLAEHAHNDFLELWIEGGTIQFVLAIAMVAIIFQRSYRAFRKNANTGLGRLAFGALIAFGAIVIHSFVDFGLHIPAVAILTTVVGAMLMNLEQMPAEPSSNRRERGRSRDRHLDTERYAFAAASDLPVETSGPKTWLPLVAVQVVSLLAVACYLVREGWNDQQAERYRLASLKAPVDQKIPYLQTAVAYAPDQVKLRADLADAYIERFLRGKAAVDTLNAAALVGDLGGPLPVAVVDAARVFQLPINDADLRKADEILARACAISPFYFGLHLRMEALSSLGIHPELQRKRLERAVELYPSEPGTWLKLARVSLRSRDNDRAYAALRNALAADPRRLSDVVKFVPDELAAKELLSKVLHDRPDLIFQASQRLSSQLDDFPDEATFARAAMKLLGSRTSPLTDNELFLKARLHSALGEREQAKSAYEDGLRRRPFATDERFELGQILVEMGDLAGARRELKIVVAEAPNNQEAKRLLESVVKTLVKGQ
jgi:O-antigen ligase/tetratricopeptide (TPR) repeat protein